MSEQALLCRHTIRPRAAGLPIKRADTDFDPPNSSCGEREDRLKGRPARPKVPFQGKKSVNRAVVVETAAAHISPERRSRIVRSRAANDPIKSQIAITRKRRLAHGRNRIGTRTRRGWAWREGVACRVEILKISRKTRLRGLGPSAPAILLVFVSVARAQGPQIDVSLPAGAAGGESMLGPRLGEPRYPEGGAPSAITPLSGRGGARGTHAPLAGLSAPTGPPASQAGDRSRIQIVPLQQADVPAYGELELPQKIQEFGPADGLTIDMAIDLLVRNNLDLVAARYEIPMAQADVLTAGLQANPVFYADTQLVPYGHFSFLRPGGPPQSDININYPLDITRKRIARKVVAERDKKVTEAQLQDAIR